MLLIVNMMSDQINNIIFVREIEKHECLYNYKLSHYSRKDLTEKAWQEVAEKANLSVEDCKKKWRNLRTVFFRKMKPSAGPRANKKAYYLKDAMQFCLPPFIKRERPPSVINLSPEPKDEMSENETIDENTVFAENWKENTYALQSTQASSPSSPPSPEVEIDIPPINTGPPQCSAVPESDKKEALKMFLLSLMPELQEFNDSQIKIFKRRVFTVIDEISNSPQSLFQPK